MGEFSDFLGKLSSGDPRAEGGSPTGDRQRIEYEATIFWETYAKIKSKWTKDPKGKTDIREAKKEAKQTDTLVEKVTNQANQQTKDIKSKLGLLGKTVAALSLAAFATWQGSKALWSRIKGDEPWILRDYEENWEDVLPPGSKPPGEIKGTKKAPAKKAPVEQVQLGQEPERTTIINPGLGTGPGGKDIMVGTEQAIGVSNKYLAEICSSMRALTKRNWLGFWFGFTARAGFWLDADGFKYL